MATVLTDVGESETTLALVTDGTNIYIGWGTGAGTASKTDTTLFTESGDETRATGTPTQQTTSSTNDTYQVIGTMTCITSSKTITNAGVFDATSSGNLYMKGDFTGVLLQVNDSIQFTMKVQYT